MVSVMYSVEDLLKIEGAIPCSTYIPIRYLVPVSKVQGGLLLRKGKDIKVTSGRMYKGEEA